MTMGVSPYERYLEKIGLLPSGYSTPAERYQRGLFGRESEGPIGRLYDLEQRFGASVGRTPGELPEWLTQNLGLAEEAPGSEPITGFHKAPGRIYTQAGEILKSLFNLTGEQREERGVRFGPTYGADAPSTPVYDVTRGEQASLFDLALRPKFGVQGAQRFARRLPEEQMLWSSGSSTNPFLDWLNTKYQLGYPGMIEAKDDPIYKPN